MNSAPNTPTTISMLIEAYVAAFNAHNLEAMIATLSEDVIHDINEGAREIGIPAFRKFKTHMDTCYKEQLADVCILTNGHRGAIEFICKGQYLATDGGLPAANGQTYAIPAAAFFEEKNGKIGRVTSYYNLKNWIAAVS